jgi:hypothetical protein
MLSNLEEELIQDVYCIDHLSWSYITTTLSIQCLNNIHTQKRMFIIKRKKRMFIIYFLGTIECLNNN